MPYEVDHAGVVSARFDRCVQDLPPRRLVDQFTFAFNSVWRRANRTLGEVTLMAIGERVLYVAAERYLPLAELKLEPDGIHSDGFLPRIDDLTRDELTNAVRFILTELLTVVGALTGEVLSPPLHAELAAITPPALNAVQPDAGRRAGRTKGNP